MTIKEAKAIDMVAYLSMRGIEPAKVKGNNYWYHSPLRSEKTPSFKVDRRRNQWYDFGEGKGGNLVDFIMLLENVSIPEVLKRLTQVSDLPTLPTALPSDPPAIKILSVHPVTSFSLIRYYQSRRITTEIANQHLQEVRYKNGDKNYYALGLQNDAGGYELRSPYFKGSCRPKAPTWFKYGAEELAVFEGFFDFLSFRTIHQNQLTPLKDFLVLNSTSFFEMCLTKMQAYRCTHLYLDNNATGSKCTALALITSPQQFLDERSLYAGYDDLNDWHQHIGSAPRPAA